LVEVGACGLAEAGSTFGLGLPIPMSGFIVKAVAANDQTLHTMALRVGYDELIADIADAFDLIPSSVNLSSQHNGTKLWVYMGSQGDLDVVLAESAEWGSHVITVEASGVSASRTLDAVGCLITSAGTISQLFYLNWMLSLGGTELEIDFFRELEVWVILGVAVFANIFSNFYLLDDESAHNHPFRQWQRPLFKRLLMLSLAPWSGDVLAFICSGVCGMHSPVRAATRAGVVKWGVILMLFQDVMMLSVLQALHGGEDGLPLSEIPRACLYATVASLAINMPRRLSHFIVGACETAYREREELADDAQINMFANQKVASGASSAAPPPVGKASPTAKPATAAPKPSSQAPSPGSRGSPPGQPNTPPKGRPPAGKPKGGAKAGGKSMM